MSDDQLVQPEEPAPESRTRVRWPLLVAGLLAIALVAGGAAWWFLTSRAQIPDWDRAGQLEFSIPAGDAFQPEAPWVRVQVAPLRVDVDSSVRLALDTTRGTPTPGSDSMFSIASLTVQPVGGATEQTPPLQREGDGMFTTTVSFDQSGWWRLAVQVAGAAQPAELYLLVPDPNINGPNAVPAFQSSSEGESLFQRGLAATSGLQTVRFTQWIADGRANSAISEQAVVAPQDGHPGGFTYRVNGGMEAVIIGSTRWVLLPGETGWQQQEGAVSLPPSEWGEEFSGATGFTVLGDETIDGRPVRRVAFVAPEQTEPRRRIVAWYLWWVDNETGHVVKEAMVSRVHYMLYRYGDFDEPLTIAPPPEAATPVVSGTPVG